MPVLAISEGELVAKAQSGDAHAFDALVGLHQGRVFALAYRILGDAEDAADVQQETFVRAWRNLRKFRGDAAFATWLHRIAVNICLSRKKRRPVESLEAGVGESLIDDRQPGGMASLIDAERAVTIRRAIAGLPGHYRILIVLREIEERPFEEIAAILRCPVQSARVRASKARKMLRERLEFVLAEELQ